MFKAAPPREESGRIHADGEWWVLLVTNGLTVSYPPELYREYEHAEREGNRWAHILSARTGEPVERPFAGRWQIGDYWVRLVYSFLPEEGSEIWVGTYWSRDGSPEPEAALFADALDARAWVLEPPAGAIRIETNETRWSAAARYGVRGGEEQAEAHCAKAISALMFPSSEGPPPTTVYGFELSEGLIPQGPVLFGTESTRDEALRQFLEGAMVQRNWADLVWATATANYVEHELPPAWRSSWDQTQAIDWLLSFDFVGDGSDFEVRRFEAFVDQRADPNVRSESGDTGSRKPLPTG